MRIFRTHLDAIYTAYIESKLSDWFIPQELRLALINYGKNRQDPSAQLQLLLYLSRGYQPSSWQSPFLPEIFNQFSHSKLAKVCLHLALAQINERESLLQRFISHYAEYENLSALTAYFYSPKLTGFELSFAKLFDKTLTHLCLEKWDSEEQLSFNAEAFDYLFSVAKGYDQGDAKEKLSLEKDLKMLLKQGAHRNSLYELALDYSKFLDIRSLEPSSLSITQRILATLTKLANPHEYELKPIPNLEILEGNIFYIEFPRKQPHCFIYTVKAPNGKFMTGTIHMSHDTPTPLTLENLRASKHTIQAMIATNGHCLPSLSHEELFLLCHQEIFGSHISLESTKTGLPALELEKSPSTLSDSATELKAETLSRSFLSEARTESTDSPTLSYSDLAQSPDLSSSVENKPEAQESLSSSSSFNSFETVACQSIPGLLLNSSFFTTEADKVNLTPEPIIENTDKPEEERKFFNPWSSTQDTRYLEHSFFKALAIFKESSSTNDENLVKKAHSESEIATYQKS